MTSFASRAICGVLPVAIATIALLSPAAPVSVAHAFEVQPFTFELVPAENGGSASVQVTNTQAEPITIDVTFDERRMSVGGENELSPSEEFIVFPPQAVIEPGDAQVLRVQWAGSPLLDNTRSFYMNVEQIPIDMDPDTASSAVQFVMTYRIAVHVSPAGAAPQPRIEKVERTQLPDGAAGVKVRVVNDGNRHLYFTQARIGLKSGTGEATLEGDALGDAIKATLLPAQSVREIVLPGESLGEGPVTASIELLSDR